MVDIFRNSEINITEHYGALRINTPYNLSFVTRIKGLLPPEARRYEPQTRTWLVDTQYYHLLRQWIKDSFGEDIGDITFYTTLPPIEMRVCDVWYLGATKFKGDESAAYGMNEKKEWIYIFPERVIKEWFLGENKEIDLSSLYGILGTTRKASAEEIKSAYRRMARQWHPDICKEPNAQETFIKIKEAYEILSNPTKREKYDAGLVLAETLKQKQESFGGYRSPLRCGYILAEGYEKIGRFIVQKILDWQDIVSNKGILVASWAPGAKEPTYSWV